MEQKDWELLFRDLCARIPYGKILKVKNPDNPMPNQLENRIRFMITYAKSKTVREAVFKHTPFLRSLDTMTEKEKAEYSELKEEWRRVEFLDSHMFDHRGLIEQGLAVKAEDGLYKFE